MHLLEKMPYGGDQVGLSVTVIIVFALNAALCDAVDLASQGVTDHHQQQLQLQIAAQLPFRRSDNKSVSLKFRRQLVGFTSSSEIDLNRRVQRTKRETDIKEHGEVSHSPCSLISHDPDLPRIVRALKRDGETHLVEYNLTFPEYSIEPLGAAILLRASLVGEDDDDSFVYKSRSWRRVMSSQGEALLSFAFNYDALSLGLLSHGVRRIDVALVDSPPLCFADQSAGRKMSLLLELVLADFGRGSNGVGKGAEGGASNERRGIDSDPLADSRVDFVCHQTVRNASGFAEFSHVCCSTDKTNCVTVKPDRLLNVLSVLLTFFKILTFLFGPILIRRIVFSESTGMTRYLVPLASDMLKTILVKRAPYGRCEPALEKGRKAMQQFVGFRRLLKDLRSEEVVRIRFRQLDIVVDDRDLMSEDEVPVGVLPLLYDAFVRCDTAGSVEPFRTCCGESVIGSWAPYFLWIRLKKHVSDCNRGCREICSWASVFRGFGGLLLMTVIALPFVVRLVVFERFEKKETEDRNAVRAQLQLDYVRCQNDLLRCLTPDHCFVIAVEVLFVVSYLVLLVARAANSELVDGLLLRSVADMQTLRRTECLRLLCAHVVLPFEKFGCLCGVLAAALYLPLALPLCFAVGLFYCVPTVYLVGRLLAAKRPRCLRTHPLPSPMEEPEVNGGGSLSPGVTSFGSCLMLNRISVDDDGPVTSQADWSADERNGIASPPSPPPRFPFSRETVARALATGLIKASTVACMLSVLAMYSEALGFLLELTVFTSVGVIANARHSIATVILVVLGLFYVTTSYRRVYARYLQLSRRIFQYIKVSQQNSVESACALRMEKSLNTAFRFSVEIDQAKTTQKLSPSCLRCSENQDQIATKENGARKESELSSAGESRSSTEETDASIEYRNNRLHWKIRSLVLFVDRNDTPRIPRELFWRLCELDFPGNPGPLRQSMARATAEAAGALIYLAVVYAVVSLSSEMQRNNTTAVQAIVVFALGSIPALVAVVCCRFFQTESLQLQLNEYSLNGKIRKAILDYERVWLVQDLFFSRSDDDLDGVTTTDGQSGNGGPQEEGEEGSQTRKTPRGRRSASRRRASFDPSQVDLLITVRDDGTDSADRPEEVSAPGHGRSGSPERGNGRRISTEVDMQKLGHAAIPLRNVMTQRNAKCLSDPLNGSSSRENDAIIVDASLRQNSVDHFHFGSSESGSPLLITNAGDVFVTVDQFHAGH